MLLVNRSPVDNHLYSPILIVCLAIHVLYLVVQVCLYDWLDVVDKMFRNKKVSFPISVAIFGIAL
jgi:hypothetical protein